MVFSKIAVGGAFKDGTPSEAGVVEDRKDKPEKIGRSIINSDKPATFHMIGGYEKGPLENRFDWAHFEWLAQNLQDSDMGNYKVRVYTKGGKYNTYSIRNGGQGEDNGISLMVFNTKEDIFLDKTSDGRQFGPNVLAPFSTVTLGGNAGYVDGLVIAKKFAPVWDKWGSNQMQNGGGLQMHGDCYNEQKMKCK
jgi:hypothetical protein